VTNKKKLLTALCAAVVFAAVVLVLVLTGGEKGVYAVPAAESVNARENSYQDYLDANGYADVLSGKEVTVDIR
jgi:hypothetical protein